MSKKRLLNILKCLIIIIAICFTSQNKNSEEKYLRNLELTLSDIIEFPVGSLPDEVNTIPVPQSSSPQSSSPITTNSTTPDNSTVIPHKKAKSSSGLSTGGIVAIVIPCVAALLGIGAITAFCRSPPTPPIQQDFPVNYMEASLDKFTAPMQEVVVQQPVPVQPVQMVQNVPVQPVQVVEESPVQQIQTFQQAPQQMALVQEVVHQPVQFVEHVPVLEQVPVTEQVPVIDQGIAAQNMAHQIGPVEQHVIHVPDPNAII